MGPSGAGKTTLLNFLTGFQTGMGGTIKSNGTLQSKKGADQYRKESCYILQDDQLQPYFTVTEAMNIAADLKVGYSISEKAKALLIDDILDTIGLSVCKETKCGRLSGGQKKRLSIALELIDNPPIMFLDEPTTGLDSSSSLQCISMLKALARGGRTIICTIHQPCATIYEMFDQVYVMSAGSCIYQGASTNTVAYLAANGLNCPQYHNPADFLLEVANGEYGDFTQELAKTAKESKWRTSSTPPKKILEEWKNANRDLYIQGNNNNNNTDQDINKTMILIYPPSEILRYWILLNRFLIQMYRDWTELYLRVALHAFVGALLGLFYFRCGNDASRTISNFGYLTVVVTYFCYTAIMPAVLKFPSELPVLRKERFNNWYKLKTFYAAFFTVDIPQQFLFATVSVGISYFMSEQPMELSRFAMFLGMCVLVNITAGSFGLFFGTVVNPVNGTFLGAILTAFMLVMGGFLVFLTHMSNVFYVASYLSYIRYGLQGLVQSIYGRGRGPIPCPEDVEYCHYRVPDVFLKEIGMADDTYWTSIGALCVNIIVLRIVAYCTLKRKLSSP
ncbi:ATP-binding cassette sub-family G member 1 isoform X2 [Agrilus planipennis]|nr:ATP-binding cassette sub-family G member 1 isoform X2 [Agrilus planipennis]